MLTRGVKQSVEMAEKQLGRVSRPKRAVCTVTEMLHSIPINKKVGKSGPGKRSQGRLSKYTKLENAIETLNGTLGFQEGHGGMSRE